MTNSIQTLEEKIQSCWAITDEIDLLYRYIGDHKDFAGMDPAMEDKIANLLLGIKSLYAIKFEECWTSYEKVLKEYYGMERQLDYAELNSGGI